MPSLLAMEKTSQCMEPTPTQMECAGGSKAGTAMIRRRRQRLQAIMLQRLELLLTMLGPRTTDRSCSLRGFDTKAMSGRIIEMCSRTIGGIPGYSWQCYFILHNSWLFLSWRICDTVCDTACPMAVARELPALGTSTIGLDEKLFSSGRLFGTVK